MEYCLYLDEQDADSNNPYFCLAGIIIDRKEYEDILIPQLNALKTKYFTNTDIIFHYTDMKNNKNGFECLQDGPTREFFWREFNDMIKNINFTTVGTYINASSFSEVYGLKVDKRYELAFRRLVNNYILFLKKERAFGDIIFESRTWTENKSIQEVFFHIINYGTDIYTAEECRKYLSTIGFITKKDNCAGIQIADFVPNTYVRSINGAKNFNNVGQHFLNKTYKINGKYNDICGLSKIM